MRASSVFGRMRAILGTTALVFVLSVWCAAQYGYPQSNYPQSNSNYGQSNSNIVVTQAPVLEYADPQTITIMWRTNVNSNSIIRFGTDPNNVGANPDQVVQLNDNSRTHRVEMRNRFQPNTTYYFQLVSDTRNGEPIVSELFTAQTPSQGAAPIRNQRLMAASDTGYNNGDNGYGNNRQGRRRRGEYARNQNYSYGQQGNGYGQQSLPQSDQPSNGNIQITRPPMLQTVGDNIAVITWRTNAPASSIVKYGTDPNNLSQTAQAPWGETLHNVTVQNLQPGTHYFFQVSSGQAKDTGTATNSDTFSFTTQPQGAQPLQRVRPGPAQ
jgi:phosphodiesterase/alkaline phosphatase D-like protein